MNNSQLANSYAVAPSAEAPAPQTDAPVMQRSDTDVSLASVHPPGAWRDDHSQSTYNNNSDQSPVAAVGNSFADALNAAGTAAAKYLPANLVNSLANYAPGMVPPPQKDDLTTDKENTTTGFQPLPALGKSDAIPPHSLTTHPLPEPVDTTAAASFKSTPQEVTKPAEFTTPSAITPAPAEKISESTNIGAGNPAIHALSTTAVSGHSTPGIDAPPSSAVSPITASSLAPSRDMSLPFSTATADVNSMSAGEHDTGVPSSTISMKSGYVGTGPTHGNTIQPKDLPAIPSPMATPAADQLEKDDLAYLAPAIRQQDSMRDAVPTTSAASKPLTSKPQVDTAGVPAADSKIGDGASAYPTPASPESTSNMSEHSRNSSGSSTGGSPRRRVTLAARIKGGSKILKGKLTKDQNKVQEGRVMLGGDA